MPCAWALKYLRDQKVHPHLQLLWNAHIISMSLSMVNDLSNVADFDRAVSNWLQLSLEFILHAFVVVGPMVFTQYCHVLGRLVPSFDRNDEAILRAC